MSSNEVSVSNQPSVRKAKGRRIPGPKIALIMITGKKAKITKGPAKKIGKER